MSGPVFEKDQKVIYTGAVPTLHGMVAIVQWANFMGTGEDWRYGRGFTYTVDFLTPNGQARMVIPAEQLALEDQIGAGCDDPSRIGDLGRGSREGSFAGQPMEHYRAVGRIIYLGDTVFASTYHADHDVGGYHARFVADALNEQVHRNEAELPLLDGDMPPPAAIYLTAKERGFLDWAVRATVAAPADDPPELTDRGIAELLDVLREGS